MAEMRYIFGDVLTGNIIAEIPLQGVSTVHNRSNGEFRGTLHLNQTGVNNETLDSATIPGRCFVVVERDGRIVGDYLITSSTYQSQAYALQLYGQNFKTYFYSRLADFDYTYDNVDQINIFLDLLSRCIQDVNAPVMYLPAFATTNQFRTLVVAAKELKSYGQLVDMIADGEGGFEWTIDTTRNVSVYERRVRFGFPVLGTTDMINLPVFEYPGNIFNYWETSSIGRNTGTHFYGVGAGEGSSMLLATATHVDLLLSEFPRYDVVISHKDVNNLDILTSLTVRDAMRGKAPAPIITAEVRDAFFADMVGNTVRLEITDAKHPSTFRKETRVIRAEYYPPESTNKEFTRLTFEGDDDGE